MELLNCFQAHKSSIQVIRYDSNGVYLLSSSTDRKIKLWNPSTISSNSTSPSIPSAIQTYSLHSHEISSLDISNDNSKFLSAGSDKQFFLWNVSTNQVLSRFSGHVGKVNVVKFAGPGANGAGKQREQNLVVSAGFDKTVRFFDLKSRDYKPIMTLEDAKDSIMDLQILGNEIFTGGLDGVLRTYDIRMGKLKEDTLDGECLFGGLVWFGGIRRKSISRASRMTTSIKEVFRVEEFSCYRSIVSFTLVPHLKKRDFAVLTFDSISNLRLNNHSPTPSPLFLPVPITSISLPPSPSSSSTCTSLILLSSLDSTHRLLDLQNGSLLQQFKGHQNKSYKCKSTFTSDGSKILAGDENGRVSCWQVAGDGQELFSTNGEIGKLIDGNQKPVFWIEMNPKFRGINDRMEFVTAGNDGMVRIWGMD